MVGLENILKRAVKCSYKECTVEAVISTKLICLCKGFYALLVLSIIVEKFSLNNINFPQLLFTMYRKIDAQIPYFRGIQRHMPKVGRKTTVRKLLNEHLSGHMFFF